MAKYRRKVVVVEAKQWFPGVEIDGVTEGIGASMPGGTYKKGQEFDVGPSEPVGMLEGPEGKIFAHPGDWVITDVLGNKSVRTHEHFALLYEEA